LAGFSSERVLLQAIAGLLIRIPEIHGIRITHGPREAGKDLVFSIRGVFGEERPCACIVKNAKTTGSVETESGARTIFLPAVPAQVYPLRIPMESSLSLAPRTGVRSTSTGNGRQGLCRWIREPD
jgi:hypothetical protein